VDRVVPLQLALKEDGCDLGAPGADGIYGAKTADCVRTFQTINNANGGEKVLPVTGVADPSTLRVLFGKVLANSEARAHLEKDLIHPYQTPEAKALMAELPSIFKDEKHWLLPLRLDIVAVGGFELYTRDESDEKNAARRVLGKESNNNTRDAFRHVQSVLRLSRYMSTEWAVRLGDMREKHVSSPLGCMYMDLFNHRAAARIAEHMPWSSDVADVAADGIRSGKLIVYPFPLVPKGTPQKIALK
jgi:hypothetical protein